MSRLMLSKNFSRKEMTCNCGCGLYIYNQEYIDKLQIVRNKLKACITINSGTRCPTHNKNEGGKENSSHLYGLAADLKADNMFLLLRYLIQEFDRIGIGSDRMFLHADIDITKPQEIYWTY